MKKIQKAKKVLSSVLALAMAFGITACNGGGGDTSGKLEIKIVNYAGGVGRAWLDDAITRFVAETKDKTYGAFTGVKFDIKHTMEMDVENIATSASHIYFGEGNLTGGLIQKGRLLNLNDIVTEVGADGKTIESKIDEEYRDVFKGNDGEYYALPHFEYFSGLSYDVELFEAKNYYFASPTATDVQNYTSIAGFGSANFVASKNTVKSCGPNGISGDYDDGLPSSVQELLILCDKMNTEIDNPIMYAGGHEHYFNHLVAGLWTSLAGGEEMKSYYTMRGDMEIVDGFSGTLFGSDVVAPTTKTQAVTEATGYYASQQAARYYASAFVELAYKNGFIENDSTTFSNIAAQTAFINSGVGTTAVSGMFVEGSYWYNEAKDYGLFENYVTATKGEKTTRTLAWMPLPVQWSGSVTEGNGKAPTLLDTSGSSMFVNGRFANNSAVVEACKDFIKFLYTDGELSAFTSTTGVARGGMDYELSTADYEKMDSFQQNLWEMRTEGSVVSPGSKTATFLNNSSYFTVRTLCSILRPKTNATYATVLSLLRTGDYTAKDAFEATTLSADKWSEYYKG